MRPYHSTNDPQKLCECGCGQIVRNRFAQGHNRKTARRPIEERFWEHVQKTETCWLWTGAKRHLGYGAINMGGGKGLARRAHRVSWEIHNGPIPGGVFVCHHCDEPACVNPAHLFLGTPLDNVRDMFQKDRQPTHYPNRRRGETHPHSKLTEQQVVAIRAEYANGDTDLYAIAARYGVGYTTIYSIVRRESWKHI